MEEKRLQNLLLEKRLEKEKKKDRKGRFKSSGALAREKNIGKWRTHKVYGLRKILFPTAVHWRGLVGEVARFCSWRLGDQHVVNSD